MSCCTRSVTPPTGSEMLGTTASTCPPPIISVGILPYDGREGLSEEQAALAIGRETIVTSWQSESTRTIIVEGYSDSVSLGTGRGASDVANLLDL